MRSLIIVFVYFSLALALAAITMPFCDEAYYGIPGRELSLKGTTGTPVIEPAGNYLTHIDRVTYWEMPLHLVFQAAWYRMVGISLFSLRTISVLFVGLGLMCWFFVLKEITEDSLAACLACAILSIDSVVLTAASVGRSDGMSFGLGAAAIASLLLLREFSPASAIIVSQTLTAASGMTHPNGGLITLGAVLYLTFAYLRKQWKPAYALYAITPYIFGALCWSVYILRDTTAFHDQFFGNTAGRLWPLVHPLSAFRGEVVGRYLSAFGWGPDLSAPHRVRLFVLAFYLGGLAASFAIPAIRNRAGVRHLQRLFFLSSTILFFAEGAKQHWYLLYVIPYYAIFSALMIQHFAVGKRTRIPAYATLLLIVAVQIGGATYSVTRRHYQLKYEPAIAFLKSRLTPKTVIMGPAELGLELPPNQIVEDYNFGLFSGKVPDYLVLPAETPLMSVCRSNRVVYQHLTTMLSQGFVRIYERTPYVILSRSDKVPYPGFHAPTL